MHKKHNSLPYYVMCTGTALTPHFTAGTIYTVARWYNTVTPAHAAGTNDKPKQKHVFHTMDWSFGIVKIPTPSSRLAKSNFGQVLFSQHSSRLIRASWRRPSRMTRCKSRFKDYFLPVTN